MTWWNAEAVEMYVLHTHSGRVDKIASLKKAVSYIHILWSCCAALCEVMKQMPLS